jgi:hypothetical protein
VLDWGVARVARRRHRSSPARWRRGRVARRPRQSEAELARRRPGRDHAGAGSDPGHAGLHPAGAGCAASVGSTVGRTCSRWDAILFELLAGAALLAHGAPALMSTTPSTWMPGRRGARAGRGAWRPSSTGSCARRDPGASATQRWPTARALAEAVRGLPRRRPRPGAAPARAGAASRWQAAQRARVRRRRRRGAPAGDRPPPAGRWRSRPSDRGGGRRWSGGSCSSRRPRSRRPRWWPSSARRTTPRSAARRAAPSAPSARTSWRCRCCSGTASTTRRSSPSSTR